MVVPPIAVPCTNTVRNEALLTPGITSVSLPAAVLTDDSSTPEPGGTDSVKSTGDGGTASSRTNVLLCSSSPTDTVAASNATDDDVTLTVNCVRALLLSLVVAVKPGGCT